MSDEKRPISELYGGLQSLLKYAFPKKCLSCGKVYASAEEFLSRTEDTRNSSGLKQSIDDDERTVVELFRNCPCGSTLMSIFSNRRDTSEEGARRREKFARLLAMLQEAGLEVDVARRELLKILHGQDSELLKKHGFDIKSTWERKDF